MIGTWFLACAGMLTGFFLYDAIVHKNVKRQVGSNIASAVIGATVYVLLTLWVG